MSSFLRIGRVYRLTGGPADSKWRWTMTARVGKRLGTGNGVALSCDDACRLVEDCPGSAVPAKDMTVTPPVR